MMPSGIEEGILLFPLPNREPKEDGGRSATNPCAEQSADGLSGGGAGFLPSPPLHGDSGTGKIGRQEQPGEPTQNAGLADSGTWEP
jgi:hypothetical protein